MKKLLTFLLVFSLSESVFSAYLIEDHLKFMSQKKQKSRWSLMDSFKKKKKGKSKAAAKPPVFNFTPGSFKKNLSREFSIGVEYGRLNVDIDGVSSREENIRASMSAFAKFVGIVAEYYWVEGEDNDFFDVVAHLRIIGDSQQNTRLNAFAGVRRSDELGDNGEVENILNYIYGGEAMLYISNVLGFSYYFTHISENTRSDINLKKKGRRHEIRVHFDYQYFRVYGAHVLEVLEYSDTSRLNRKETTGLMGGIKIYF